MNTATKKSVTRRPAKANKAAALFPASRAPQKVVQLERVKDVDTGETGTIIKRDVAGSGKIKVKWDNRAKATLIDADQLAKANPQGRTLKRFAIRNFAGFVDASGFHPIRSSEGYNEFKTTDVESSGERKQRQQRRAQQEWDDFNMGLHRQHKAKIKELTTRPHKGRANIRSLSQFVRARGGIAPSTGSEAAELLSPRETGTSGLLNQNNRLGRSKYTDEYMMDAANVEGYRDRFGSKFKSIGEFLHAVVEDATGHRKLYSDEDNNRLAALANPGTSAAKSPSHPAVAAKSPSGSKKNPQQKFSVDTLRHLRKSFAAIDGANIENHRADFDKVFAGTSRPLLKQLAEGKIEWVSPLAKNALVARRNPAVKKNLHPLEIGSNIAMIIGGLDHVRTMMSRSKKKPAKKAAKKKNSSSGKSAVTSSPKKNLGLLDLVANLQAAEYIGSKLKKKRNPNTPALQKIRQDFLGRENSGKVIKLYTPADAPKDVGAMAQLVRITLANGRVQQFAKGSAWLGGYQRGSCRRMVIGLKQPFAPPNGLDADKQHDYGEVKKIEYLAHKPHLYGDGSPEYLFFHPMGEEGGSRPHLVLDSGCLKLVGGSYKILREGISD